MPIPGGTAKGKGAPPGPPPPMPGGVPAPPPPGGRGFGGPPNNMGFSAKGGASEPPNNMGFSAKAGPPPGGGKGVPNPYFSGGQAPGSIGLSKSAGANAGPPG